MKDKKNLGLRLPETFNSVNAGNWRDSFGKKGVAKSFASLDSTSGEVYENKVSQGSAGAGSHVQ
jgi:hypothetical protein